MAETSCCFRAPTELLQRLVQAAAAVGANKGCCCPFASAEHGTRRGVSAKSVATATCPSILPIGSAFCDGRLQGPRGRGVARLAMGNPIRAWRRRRFCGWRPGLVLGPGSSCWRCSLGTGDASLAGGREHQGVLGRGLGSKRASHPLDGYINPPPLSSIPEAPTARKLGLHGYQQLPLHSSAKSPTPVARGRDNL